MSRNDEPGRLNMSIPPDLNKRFNTWMLAWANKQGKVPSKGLKTAVGRMALEEWLTKHAKDYNIKINNP